MGIERAGSSTGKSYNAIEVTRGYFPNEDVISHDYVSPTAFFHKQTQLSIKDNEQFYPLLSRRAFVEKQYKMWLEQNPKPDSGVRAYRAEQGAAKARFKEEWDNLDKVMYWDLSRKIILFKDSPHDDVLRNLRSLVSKDDALFEANITDKSSSGQHATKSIILSGRPTFLYCSASYSQDAQERTRFFLLSPDVDKEKTQLGVKMTISRSMNRPKFQSDLERDKARERLQERVKAIRAAHIDDVVFSDDLQKYVNSKISESYENPQPRLMRDASRMVALMKAHALLNFSNREMQNEGILVGEKQDVDAGFALYQPIAKANERGIPPQVYDFCIDTLIPKINDSDVEGITRNEFTALWFEEFQEQLGYKQMIKILHLASNAGLLYEEKDPENRNRYLIRSDIHYSRGGVCSRHQEQEELISSDIEEFVEQNKEAIAQKREEVGRDILNDEGAARILMRDREATA